MKISAFFLSIPLIAILCSCENGEASKPTKHEEQVLQTYISLVVLNESFPPTTNQDSTVLYRHRVDSILTASGFTQEEFQKEFQEIVSSPDRFQPLMQEMVETIQQRNRRR